MPNWLIVIIVVAVIGGIIGLFASLGDDNIKPHEGCLSGALMGGIGSAGCLAELIIYLAPFILGILFLVWLFS